MHLRYLSLATLLAVAPGCTGVITTEDPLVERQPAVEQSLAGQWHWHIPFDDALVTLDVAWSPDGLHLNHIGASDFITDLREERRFRTGGSMSSDFSEWQCGQHASGIICSAPAYSEDLYLGFTPIKVEPLSKNWSKISFPITETDRPDLLPRPHSRFDIVEDPQTGQFVFQNADSEETDARLTIFHFRQPYEKLFGFLEQSPFTKSFFASEFSCKSTSISGLAVRSDRQDDDERDQFHQLLMTMTRPLQAVGVQQTAAAIGLKYAMLAEHAFSHPVVEAFRLQGLDCLEVAQLHYLLAVDAETRLNHDEGFEWTDLAREMYAHHRQPLAQVESANSLFATMDALATRQSQAMDVATDRETPKEHIDKGSGFLRDFDDLAELLEQWHQIL